MKRNKKLLWLYGLMTLAAMGMIFFMSAKDANESGSMSKWLVNTSFGRMLIKLLPRLTDRGDEIDLRKFCFLYACSDEYHQTFVPGRAGAMIDVAVDMAGVLFGLALVLLACMTCMRRKELK